MVFQSVANITKEIILSEIRMYYEEFGERPSERKFLLYMRGKGLNCHPTYKKYGGHKWNELISMAGLTPLRYSISNEEIIELIKKYYVKTGRFPKMQDFKENFELPDHSTVIRHFGSFANAFQATGIVLNFDNLDSDSSEGEPEKEHELLMKRELLYERTYTRDEDGLIKCIQDFHYKHHRAPRRDELRIDRSVFERVFGSWKKALEAANVKPLYPSSYGAIYRSNHGDVRKSLFEGLIDDYLWNKTKVEHEHDVPYSRYLETDREVDFDFVIFEEIFIECAGMITEDEFYEDRRLNKKTQEYKNRLKQKLQIIEENKDFFQSKVFIVLFKEHDPKSITYKENLEPVIKRINEKIGKVEETFYVGTTLQTSKYLRKYTENELIEFVKKRGAELGKRPRLRDMGVPGYPAQKTFYKRHKWNWWVSKAGYYPRLRPDIVKKNKGTNGKS